MATVSFIPYARQSGGTLSAVCKYVMQEAKTVQADGLQLTSGLNCSPQFAAQEFGATRRMHHKDSPVWFYHYVQSFHPKEPVTAKEAQAIAREFAAKAWPDSEVLLATHIDANHIHTHFLVNSVCLESGKMLRQGPDTLRKLRKLSDELCLAHGLSVLPPKPQTKSKGMSGREYRSASKGQSVKFQLMNIVDQCMRFAHSKEEFVLLMRSEGYDVRWADSRKNITYTTPSGWKCRDDRLHEEKYLKEAMEREFSIRAEIFSGRAEAEEPGSGSTSASAVTLSSHRGGVDSDDPAASISESAAFRPEQCASCGNVGTAEGADCSSEADEFSAGTGWEAEREALFSAETDPSQSPYSQAGTAGGGIDLGDISGLLGDVAHVARSVESTPEPLPVKIAPIDRKARKKNRERKLALGQRLDDHEDEQNQKYQHSM